VAQDEENDSLVHIAPDCTGSGEGSDHFGSYIHSLFLHFCKRLVPDGPPWSIATTSPRSTSINPVQHQHTKHVEIDLHFIRERVRCSRPPRPNDLVVHQHLHQKASFLDVVQVSVQSQRAVARISTARGGGGTYV
jgi:hypothetical protein